MQVAARETKQLKCLVDSGLLVSDIHTAHKVAADIEKVDSAAVVQLMYGQVCAGLRQLCVREILQHTPFSRKSLPPCSATTGFSATSL